MPQPENTSLPLRNTWNFGKINTILVLACDLLNLFEQPVGQCRRIETQSQKTIIGNVKLVLVRLFARVFEVSNLCSRPIRDHLRQITYPVGFSHLIEDVDALTGLRRILDGQRDTANGVLDVDEGARLTTRAVHAEWIIDSGLHQKR